MKYIHPGATEYFYFHSFDSNDPSVSTTISGFALADIKIFKDGGTTERASTSGFTLLDTDGIDFSAETGINGISIDFSDNTTAGFYECGHHYSIVVGPITIDAGTVNFVLDQFRIGYEGAILNTSIATYTSAISFTLSEGSTQNDAYNRYTMIAHDLTTAYNIQHRTVNDYVGATKELIVDGDPGIFTMAAGDSISLFAPNSMTGAVGQNLIGDGSSGDKIRA